MILFKTFWNILKQCKVPILLYTVLLIVFGGFQLKTSDTAPTFVASKPDLLVINQDEEKGLTQSLVTYLKKNSHVVQIQETEEAIQDALFYRDINYVIMIPKGFREQFLKGKQPKVMVKSTQDYQASLAERMLNRYLRVATLYLNNTESEEKLISKVENTLKREVAVQITSKRNTSDLEQATFYFNFASYSILAGCVFVICLILSSFEEQKIRKRTLISSMPLSKYNRNLLLSNSLFAITLWFFYVLLGILLLGDIMFSMYGLAFLLNSFVFVLCALSLAFLIGTLVQNKNAINGIVNVVALGSSFLCGAFVPMDLLPDAVLKIAHGLPTYYYIKNNELISKLETFHPSNILPLLENLGILLLFSLAFVLLTNWIARRKQKIG